MEERDLAVTLARGRIAFGVVSLLAPGLVARTMTGRRGLRGGTRLFVRMIGARDLGVGVGLHVALDRDAPTRGWLEASAVVDGIDAAGSLLARHHLRPGVFPGHSAAAATERCSAAGWHDNSTHSGGWTASDPPSSVGAAPRARRRPANFVQEGVKHR